MNIGTLQNMGGGTMRHVKYAADRDAYTIVTDADNGDTVDSDTEAYCIGLFEGLDLCESVRQTMVETLAEAERVVSEWLGGAA